MPFIYYLSAPDRDLELARAELWALTGAEATGRLACSPVACDISRSAYVALCAEQMAWGSNLEGLCRAAFEAGIAANGFRIEVIRLEPGLACSSLDVARRVADVISGSPNLSQPRMGFVVFASSDRWLLGRVLSRGAHGPALNLTLPRSFSCSLTMRHARALVNLVAAPGDTLLDPCCGAGTCLIQAHAVGIRASGYDLNPALVRAAAENLRAVGFEATVGVADMRKVSGEYDAAVLDLPYGHSSHPEADLYENALNNIAPRVSKIGVVTGQQKEDLFEALGLRILRSARVSKNRLVRHFTVLAGLRYPRG